MSTLLESRMTVRRATPEDADICGEICFDAFSAISAAHGFPPDFPHPAMAIGLLGQLFSTPGFFCLVAEADGRIAGSICLDERAPIVGLGPVTIDPSAQDRGAGRRLMREALERSRARGAEGVRLVQAAFHCRSLALYASLGFVVREPLACMQGRTRERAVPGCAVRPARAADEAACGALARQVHGFDRQAEWAEAVGQGTALVVERAGRITGYASALGLTGHAVAEADQDLQALIASAEGFHGPGILVPTRNPALFRWCLDQGLRVVQPMTLMSLGRYNEPAGAWLPSVSY